MLVSDRVEITYHMKNGDVHVNSVKPEHYQEDLEEYYYNKSKNGKILILDPKDLVDNIENEKLELMKGTIINACDVDTVSWVRVLTDSSYYEGKVI